MLLNNVKNMFRGAVVVAAKNPVQLEQETIKKMIYFYCQGKHGTRQNLCRECLDLLDYALRRLENCKFADAKPTCKKCPVHCFKPDKREQVKLVMRYVGPRIIFKHPIEAVRYLFHP